jgi:hypothetical protein
MITVISFTKEDAIVYGTAMDDGAGYERFFGYSINVPDPCDAESIATALEAQEG